VPVLIHDDQVWKEINDILRYIDEQFPSTAGSWFPSSEAEKQKAMELMQLEDE
jgi:glutathione S-transferase